jgi:hypothetical protein
MLAMFRRGPFYNYLSIYLRHFLGLSVAETTLFATLPMALNIFFQTFVWGLGLSDGLPLGRRDHLDRPGVTGGPHHRPTGRAQARPKRALTAERLGIIL